jgi:hypothetical protein
MPPPKGNSPAKPKGAPPAIRTKAQALEELAKRANSCMANAEGIPGYPFFTLLNANKFGSMSSFERLQHTIDYLTCKAKAGIFFTEEEKTFLYDLFINMGRGGRWNGWSEASQLAYHYVDGKGKPITINADVYRTSVIVKDAMEAIKDYIRDQISKKGQYGSVKTNDPLFLRSPQAARIHSKSRSSKKQGRLLINPPDKPEEHGSLITEQSNDRLFHANNRFVLASINSLNPNGPKTVMTTWSVDDYTFEPFDKKSDITDLTIGENMVLKLPDGLSRYMVDLGIAQEFHYSASWMERWDV